MTDGKVATEGKHATDDVLGKTLLLVNALVIAFRRSNLAETALGLRDLSELLTRLRQRKLDAADDTPANWRAVRSAIAEARGVLAELSEALEALDDSTRARRRKRSEP